MNLLEMLINKLQNLLNNLKPREAEVVEEPSFNLAFLQAMKVVEDLKAIGYTLEDTSDWMHLKTVYEVGMNPLSFETKLREVKNYFESGLFKLESFRDELQIIKDEVKLYEYIQSKGTKGKEGATND